MKPTIKERIKNYFKTKKWWSIALDFLFYLLILLFLIPSTRRTVWPVLMRTVLHPPLKKVSTVPEKTLGERDLQWPLTTLEGRKVTLGDYKGRVLFVNLWATWCPPCRAEMPGIEKLFREYGDRVTFLMIAGDTPQKVKEYLKDHKYTFPVLIQTVATPPSLKTRSIPTTFIIDKQGNIVLEHKGASKWNARKIRRLLDELLEER
jgi:thiol-disulfide isomerase/thioredoxin